METLDRQTQERIARNDATFRDANENIAAAVAEHGLLEEKAPFICECADPTCTEIIQMSLSDYRHVRSSPRWFLKVPSHVANDRGIAVVVEEHDGYVLAEKIGYAGEVAEALAQEGPS